MYIEKLKLRNFRNYTAAELEFSPLTNIIYGNNAQGKTNILEAVYLFSQGRSHRAKTDKELVKFGCDFASIGAEFSDSERKHIANMHITENGRKCVSVNHISITKLSRLMNYLNVVMFSPEDLDLVKSSPNVRRRFIDSAISQLSPAYMASLMEYNKVLKQKNSLLKKGEKALKTLEVWNIQLSELIVKITNAREEFTKSIGEFAHSIQMDISKENLLIEYLPNIKIENFTAENVLDFLNGHREREIYQGAALYGVQSDDLRIFVNGNEAKLFASQGQQRTCALSMKIAQSEYINSIKGEYPVLLLDDIMSELDINRRMYLSERIKDKQVLITSTDTDISEKNTSTKLFKLHNGKVVG